MAKRKGRQQQKQQKAAIKQAPTQDQLQGQLHKLIKQEKFEAAIAKHKELSRAYPAAEIEPPVGQLWFQWGQSTYHQADYGQATIAFQQALDLGQQGETHYWLAKSLLAEDRTADALAMVRTAFTDKTLPKDYCGCYLKLLFLAEETETVADLIVHQAKRFYAPQLHWARGMLALGEEKFDIALTHFKKMGRPATPGDQPAAWLAFTHQQVGNWKTAEGMLGITPPSPFFSMGLQPKFPSHPVMQQLAIAQVVACEIKPSDVIDLTALDPDQRFCVVLLELLHLISENNVHDAAHIALKLGYQSQTFPEFEQIYPTIMLLAGEQALHQDELDCTETFWEEYLKHAPFDPQIAYQLFLIYEQNDSGHESQRIIQQLIHWLQKEAKQNPQSWPPQTLNPTLAKLKCLYFDVLMMAEQQQTGLRILKEAEKICPTSPETMGRRGLLAFLDDRSKDAVALMTQALEQGCSDRSVYEILLEALEELGNEKDYQDIRRRFGKQFGDLDMPQELAAPIWIDALSTQNYRLFSQLTSTPGEHKEPAQRACQIFNQAAEDQPNSGQRVTLNQKQATQNWETLLKSLDPPDQIPVLQAIFLSIQLYAKRKKGIVALLTQYESQLAALGGDYPIAKTIHLALLVVKGLKQDRLQDLIQKHLATASQPGTALAQIQLQARRFTASDALRPILEQALKREPQNPQLLLAKATTFSIESQDYTDHHDAGFELARRLQDAAALQAFREEEAYKSTLMTKEIFPDLLDLGGSFGGPLGLDPDDLIRKMMRKIMGEDVPPAIIEQMLPEFKQMIENGPPFDDDDEDWDGPDLFDSPFQPPPDFLFGPPPTQKRSKRRKR